MDLENPDVPDMTHGDYYCRVCDSHMNAALVWEAHVTGKKHLKNVKKGETEIRYVEPSDPESCLKYELRNVQDPIVGLSYITEVRKGEPGVPPTFSCFLCHSNTSSVPVMIEHILSSKHRSNYIKVRDVDQFKMIQMTNLSKQAMEPLITEAARKLMQAYGKGTVKVKQERKKNSVTTFNLFDSDDEETQDSSKLDTNASSKKSHDVEKKHRERSRSRKRTRSRSKDYKDSYKSRRYRSRSKEDSYVNRRSRRSPSLRRSPSPRRRSPSPRRRSPSPRRRSPSPRKRSKSPRSPQRSSRSAYDKKHSSYFHNESTKKQHSPKRDVYERQKSFSKKGASPDSNRYKSLDDDYVRSSRKNDLPDNQIDRYNRTNTQESIDKSYKSTDHRTSVSSLVSAEQNLHLSENLGVKNLIVLAIEAIKNLSSKEQGQVISFIADSIFKVSSMPELIMLAHSLKVAQKKLLDSHILQNHMEQNNIAALRAQIPGSSQDASSVDQSVFEAVLNLSNRPNTSSASNNASTLPFRPSSSCVPGHSVLNPQHQSPVVYEAPPVRYSNSPQQAQGVGKVMTPTQLGGNAFSSINQHRDVRSNISQHSVDPENFLNSIFRQSGIPSSSTSSYQGIPMSSGTQQVPYQNPSMPYPQGPTSSNYSSPFPPNYPKY